MKLRGGWFPRWTPEQDAYLLAHWGKVNYKKIAARLNRSADACCTRAKKLKATRSQLCRNALFTGQNFKGREFYLRILELHATMSYLELAQHLNVPHARAKNWCRRAQKYLNEGKLNAPDQHH